MSAEPEHVMPTPPVVDVSYRVEGTDQTDASIAFFLTKGRIFLVMLAMFVLSQLVTVTMELTRGHLSASTILLPIIIVVAVVVSVLYWPRLLLKRLSEPERQVRFRISDLGLEILGGASQSRVNWEAIAGISVLKRGTLFHFKASPSIFLSSRRMTPEDREVVKQWAAWHKPAKSTSSRWVLLLWLALVGLFVIIYNLVSR